LPFQPVAGFAGLEGSAKQVVVRDDGYWAVIDQGEFGGGLFWVPSTTRRAQRMDAPSGEPVRWLEELTFGTLALSGLCHGEACARRTDVFRLERTKGGAGPWQLLPLARLEGCPSSVTVEPNRDALLVSGCGALYRVTAHGAEPVGRWPKALIAQDVQVASVAGSPAYYVSFGGVVARFAGTAPPSWLAPQACSRFATAPDGRCTCGAP